MQHSMLDAATRADAFFMEVSPIHETMRRLCATFAEMNIPFAIAGAMAANAHGHKRTTDDVDILLRQEDLERFKEQWLGRGWVEKFEGSRGFRDATNNVNIDVLVAGDYPGDGLPKPVVFPDPEKVVEQRDEAIPFISLKTLLELKLASGISAVHRLQDLADVIQLIRVNALPREYAEQLDSYVRSKFAELWTAAQVNDDF